MKNLRKHHWGYVGAWVFLIYSTLYIVRPICDFLKKTTPFGLISNITIVLVFVVVVFLLWTKFRIKKISSYIYLALALMAYSYYLINLQYPEEKLHLIEYGILGYLVYKAMRIDIKGFLGYLSAFLLTAFLGWIDEEIQRILPNRYFQVSDVVLNAQSGALGLFIIYIFEREMVESDTKI